jgi:hypothetical protein
MPIPYPDYYWAQSEEKLRKLHSFHVGLAYKATVNVEPGDMLPVHGSVIRPLLAKAVECRVYGFRKNSELTERLVHIAQLRGRVWNLDLGQELIRGHERLWNEGCVHHGIVIVSSVSPQDMQPILTECHGPYVMASLYQIQEGNSKAAVSYCQKIAEETNHTAFLLPGSNGIEWADIFANDDQLVALWSIASACR